MTTEQLEKRVSYQWKGYGNYKIYIEYRGKVYTCYSHNSLAIDRINKCEYGDNTVESIYGYTYKEALQSLYNECKRNNKIK